MKKTIVLVTLGRTGSTLLQGIINTIDGACICGESAGAFNDIWALHKKMRITISRQGYKQTDPWFFRCVEKRSSKYP